MFHVIYPHNWFLHSFDTGGEPYFQARLEEKNMLNLCSDREFTTSISFGETADVCLICPPDRAGERTTVREVPVDVAGNHFIPWAESVHGMK